MNNASAWTAKGLAVLEMFKGLFLVSTYGITTWNSPVKYGWGFGGDNGRCSVGSSLSRKAFFSLNMRVNNKCHQAWLQSLLHWLKQTGEVSGMIQEDIPVRTVRWIWSTCTSIWLLNCTLLLSALIPKLRYDAPGLQNNTLKMKPDSAPIQFPEQYKTPWEGSETLDTTVLFKSGWHLTKYSTFNVMKCAIHFMLV